MADAGLRVNGRLYPVPAAFTLGEARTIKRITGLTLPEFAQALGRLDVDQDPDVFAAFVWVTVHREDHSITPEQIDELEFDAVVPEGGEAESPLASVTPTGPGDASATSAAPSNGSPPPSSEAIPVPSGLQP